MIIEPQDLRQKLVDIKRSPKVRKGVPTGFCSLDEFIYLDKQYLAVITGIPSCGKSEVLDSISLNTAIMQGWNWLYFSPENFPLEEHLRKLVEKYIGKSLKQMTDNEMQNGVDFIQKHFAWIHPDDGYSLADILQSVQERIEMGYPVDAIVIDPWNELDHSSQAGMRDDQYISKSLTTLRLFHRKYNLLSCVVIHPTKLQKDNQGNYPVPTLYDCNGGAMWRNKADYGISVHRRDFDKHEAEIYIQKVKFKTMGRLGTTTLDYDLVSGRFKDKLNPSYTIPAAEDLPL